jgi:LysM repeat protein
MNHRVFLFLLIVITALMTGCAYFQKKDEPPPLPPIEETKPPLTMKSDYFKSYPWGQLPKPRKDGNDPDTTTYTVKEGETLESVAENLMGDPSLAAGLASFNDLSSPSSVKSGEKIVIPYPIIGVNSEIMVKSKGESDFGTPRRFGVEFKKGDEYKLRFEPNVDGYIYALRKGAKGLEYLYPAQVKISKRNKSTQPLMRDTGKVNAHEAVEIPIGKKGFAYDPKKVGDMIYVFLSLRKVPELEDLKEKKTLRVEDVEDVMHRVKEGEVLNSPPYHLLRIIDPSEILGFSVNIDG